MQTLIFLNGEKPGKKIVKYFVDNSPYIIAADGGANYLKKEGIEPSVILGDLDSITSSVMTYFQNKGIQVIEFKDQSKTDFEKCLIYCLLKKHYKVTVFGATSMRPDHTLNNFSILKRYCRKLDIKIITNEFEIFFIDKNINFKYKKNEIVSLLAFHKATNIYTTGLEFKLTNQNLEFGKKEGALNKSVSDKISIRFKTGNILLFRKHFIT